MYKLPNCVDFSSIHYKSSFMEFSRFLILLFSIPVCLIILVLIQTRFHFHNTKEQQYYLHMFSRISLPPSPAPKPAPTQPKVDSSPPHKKGDKPLPSPPHKKGDKPLPSPAHKKGDKPLPSPPHKKGDKPPPSPPPNKGDSPSTNSTSVLNVLNFGAVGDGITDDTQSFKMAWDSACSSQGKSSPIVLVPRGYSFMIQSTIFTGPCKSGLVLQIDGTLMPPNGPKSWPLHISKRQWLVFYKISGFSMQGMGVVDGRGEKWWNLPCKPHKGINGTTLPGPCDSPVAISFFMSSNLTVRGLKIRNSPQFHFKFDTCQNVYIDFLNINSPALSPNTDGIHLGNSNNVKIYNSVISNGDDCVSIGAGCYNVDIKNITCGPSHGISIGSLGPLNSRACVSNITVNDSVIKYSNNGVRIKTWQGGSGAVSKISFKNIKMDTVRNPIIIDQYYCQAKTCTNQSSGVFISDILYMNIKGTYDVRSPPMHFGCSDSVPCTNLTLSQIELLPVGRHNALSSPFCWKAYGSLHTVTIPPVSCLLEGFPQLVLGNVANQC